MSTCTALGVADFVRYDDPWVPYFPPLSFFFNDTATTEIYTLSLHDALPIATRRPPSRAASSMDGRSSRSRTAKSRSARRSALTGIPSRLGSPDRAPSGSAGRTQRPADQVGGRAAAPQRHRHHAAAPGQDSVVSDDLRHPVIGPLDQD